MIAMTLGEIARVTGGTVSTVDTGGLVVSGAAYTDSRSPVAGGLYLAIVGERSDGHDHAGGAHAVLGSRPTSAPTVVVADPVVAAGRLARHVVDALGVPVLALTGSQGKTGTKDLLAHVLAGAGPTVATAANNNNELGVPLTVLRADAGTESLVVEMGARGIGHIAYLCELAPPRVAAVLNVGTAHVGEFGGVEAIVTAKGEIVEALPAEGVAVLNADDHRVVAMGSRTRARVLTFGAGGEVTWRGLVMDGEQRPTFELGHDGAWTPVRLRLSGVHQVSNAAAAAAMAIATGVDLNLVGERLCTAESGSRWRMEVARRCDGLTVINDAYNANPASMTAALDTLGGWTTSGRRIAVLGEMKELGHEHDAAHLDVGRRAGEAGVDLVVVVGAPAELIGTGVRESGQGEAIITASREAALAWVRENAGADDVVLVKASRGAALEWVADQLLADETTGEGAETR